MEDFKTVDTSTLLDMLSQKTQEYTQLLHNGALPAEFQGYEVLIGELQAEIRSRQQPPTSQNALGVAIF